MSPCPRTLEKRAEAPTPVASAIAAYGPQTPTRYRPRDASQLVKSIVDIATGETNDREPAPEEQGKGTASAVSLGRSGGLKGGKARAASMTPGGGAQIAKAAAKARWNKR
jgi:hypothetical protein